MAATAKAPTGMYFNSAIQAGAQALTLALGGETKATRASYDKEYHSQMQRHAAQKTIAAAQKNISVVKQNRILSNTDLQMKQDQAAAAVKVSAAVAGAEGTNVDGAIQQTETNQALAMGLNESKGQAQIDGYLAQTNAATLQMVSAKSEDIDWFSNAVNQQLSSFNSQDLKNVGTWAEEKDWFGGGVDGQIESGAVRSQTSGEDGELDDIWTGDNLLNGRLS
jgi:hypothetical protein